MLVGMGIQPLQQFMKGPRVIEVAQMGKLMEEDVVLELWRDKDEPPIEGYGARFAAGSPAAFLVTDGNPMNLDPNSPGVKEQPLWQVFTGYRLEQGGHLLFRRTARIHGKDYLPPAVGNKVLARSPAKIHFQAIPASGKRYSGILHQVFAEPGHPWLGSQGLANPVPVFLKEAHPADLGLAHGHFQDNILGTIDLHVHALDPRRPFQTVRYNHWSTGRLETDEAKPVVLCFRFHVLYLQ